MTAKAKDFLDCFIDFVSDSGELTTKELEEELMGLGFDPEELKKRV